MTVLPSTLADYTLRYNRYVLYKTSYTKTIRIYHGTNKDRILQRLFCLSELSLRSANRWLVGALCFWLTIYPK